MADISGLFDVGAYAARHPRPYSDMEKPRYLAGNRAPMGMVEPGNVNLMTRPNVWNPEAGGYSSVYSMSFDDGGKHVLVPLVTDDGKIDDVEAAVGRYRKTGKHLGVFSSSDFADAYAEQLHKQQEAMLRVTGLLMGDR